MAGHASFGAVLSAGVLMVGMGHLWWSLGCGGYVFLRYDSCSILIMLSDLCGGLAGFCCGLGGPLFVIR